MSKLNDILDVLGKVDLLKAGIYPSIKVSRPYSLPIEQLIQTILSHHSEKLGSTPLGKVISNISSIRDPRTQTPLYGHGFLKNSLSLLPRDEKGFKSLMQVISTSAPKINPGYEGFASGAMNINIDAHRGNLKQEARKESGASPLTGYQLTPDGSGYVPSNSTFKNGNWETRSRLGVNNTGQIIPRSVIPRQLFENFASLMDGVQIDPGSFVRKGNTLEAKIHGGSLSKGIDVVADESGVRYKLGMGNKNIIVPGVNIEKGSVSPKTIPWHHITQILNS